MEKIRAAQQAIDDAHQHLHDAVLEARSQGATWAEIGSALGMSRQAAFKRFGKPTNPTTGEPMAARSVENLPALTEKFFTLVAEGNEEGAMGMMHHRVRKELPWTMIIDLWTQILGEYGELESFANTFVTAPKGTQPDASLVGKAMGKMMGVAVGVTTLEHEAGEMMGRVAFDKDDAVVGILYLPTDATDLAF